jgi:DNA-binding transcriptional LysR family regulator
MMDTLKNMRTFVRVVEAGGFTAAATSLDMSTGQVSRAVTELEAHLRTRLLNRSTRHVGLTEAGQRYLHHSYQILASVDQARRRHPTRMYYRRGACACMPRRVSASTM